MFAHVPLVVASVLLSMMGWRRLELLGSTWTIRCLWLGAWLACLIQCDLDFNGPPKGVVLRNDYGTATREGMERVRFMVRAHDLPALIVEYTSGYVTLLPAGTPVRILESADGLSKVQVEETGTQLWTVGDAVASR